MQKEESRADYIYQPKADVNFFIPQILSIELNVELNNVYYSIGHDKARNLKTDALIGIDVRLKKIQHHSLMDLDEWLVDSEYGFDDMESSYPVYEYLYEVLGLKHIFWKAHMDDCKCEFIDLNFNSQLNRAIDSGKPFTFWKTNKGSIYFRDSDGKWFNSLGKSENISSLTIITEIGARHIDEEILEEWAHPEFPIGEYIRWKCVDFNSCAEKTLTNSKPSVGIKVQSNAPKQDPKKNMKLNNMFASMGVEMGQYEGDDLAWSMAGTAVKKSEGNYLVYDRLNKQLIEVADFKMDVPFMLMPIKFEDINEGDMIRMDGKFLIVEGKTANGGLKCVDPRTGSSVTKIARTNMFNMYFYTKVFSFMDGMGASNNGMPFNPMMMMMMGGKADGDNSMMNMMMMSQMMGGQNMFAMPQAQHVAKVQAVKAAPVRKARAPKEKKVQTEK